MVRVVVCVGVGCVVGYVYVGGCRGFVVCGRVVRVWWDGEGGGVCMWEWDVW